MASQEHMEITLEFASDVFVSTKVLVMSCDFLNYSIVAVHHMFWQSFDLSNQFFPRG